MSFVNNMYLLEKQKKKKEEFLLNYGNNFGIWGPKKKVPDKKGKKPFTSIWSK